MEKRNGMGYAGLRRWRKNKMNMMMGDGTRRLLTREEWVKEIRVLP